LTTILNQDTCATSIESGIRSQNVTASELTWDGISRYPIPWPRFGGIVAHSRSGALWAGGM